jgi:hypothetical protein
LPAALVGTSGEKCKAPIPFIGDERMLQENRLMDMCSEKGFTVYIQETAAQKEWEIERSYKDHRRNRGS